MWLEVWCSWWWGKAQKWVSADNGGSVIKMMCRAIWGLWLPCEGGKQEHVCQLAEAYRLKVEEILQRQSFNFCEKDTFKAQQNVTLLLIYLFWQENGSHWRGALRQLLAWTLINRTCTVKGVERVKLRQTWLHGRVNGGWSVFLFLFLHQQHISSITG